MPVCWLGVPDHGGFLPAHGTTAKLFTLAGIHDSSWELVHPHLLHGLGEV